jgi:hypothetical protein
MLMMLVEIEGVVSDFYLDFVHGLELMMMWMVWMEMRGSS